MVKLVNRPAGMQDILTQMEQDQILSRIWAHDFRVWREDPAEIANRLGWLHLPETMPKTVADIESFVDAVRQDDFTHVLLLGMGGSSLAPETFALTFGSGERYPSLHVHDSTHPDAVRRIEGELDLSNTLFIVATKSGTTTETLSFFRHFYNRTAHIVGTKDVGNRFVAITDPGSPLTTLAEQHGFRRVFENDPNLGGRYSALSHFGLVPAALLGVDLPAFLEQAQTVARACTNAQNLSENPAVQLGAFLGAAALAGRDKLTFVLSEDIASFGNWAEQLIAESTGKAGVGILPVVGESLGPADIYGEDRLFVSVSTGEHGAGADKLHAIAKARHPVAHIQLDDTLELGGLCFLWELATAIAGYVLHINPFDQPNVEAAKVLAKHMVRQYEETGALPESFAQASDVETLAEFLGRGVEGSYVALQAYAPPCNETARALADLQSATRNAYGLATTAGVGPRFLHSTGQLHKGDGGNGLFVQLLVDATEDVPIPGHTGDPAAALTFGALIAAQAAGDRQALADVGRPVLTLQLDRNSSISSQLHDLAAGLRSRGPDLREASR